VNVGVFFDLLGNDCGFTQRTKANAASGKGRCANHVVDVADFMIYLARSCKNVFRSSIYGRVNFSFELDAALVGGMYDWSRWQVDYV
jgi:hypothetical protein